MSIPIHPSTVHFPITFLGVSYALDALPSFQPFLPALITSHLPDAAELTRISYYALTLGILTSLPAIMSGGAQAVQAISKQGLYESDQQTIKPKFKTLIAHVVANDVVIGISAYSWWNRSAKDSANTGNLLTTLSAVLLGLGLLWSAHQGGKLTYENGFGLSLGKKGKGA